MNRWTRLTLEEFIRTGAFLALMVGCLFITVPFLVLVTLDPHSVPAMWGLALLHLALIIAWVVHSFFLQAHHAWAVMRGRAKGILKPPRLSWRWQIGYFIVIALCLVGEWWWLKAIQEARAASAPVACADRCWSIVRLT